MRKCSIFKPPIWTFKFAPLNLFVSCFLSLGYSAHPRLSFQKKSDSRFPGHPSIFPLSSPHLSLILSKISRAACSLSAGRAKSPQTLNDVARFSRARYVAALFSRVLLTFCLMRLLLGDMNDSSFQRLACRFTAHRGLLNLHTTRRISQSPFGRRP